MRRKLWILLILALALFLYPYYTAPADAPLQATFIDIGQGDSCWLHLPNGDDVLVDGGGRAAGPTVVAYLQQQGVTDIDLMVATHGHEDHIGGFVDVLASMPVHQAWVDSITCTSGTCKDLYQALMDNHVVVSTVSMGERYAWGQVTALVLNPSQPLDGDKNENSIVLRVSHGSVDFLLSGDAETGGEGRMLRSGLPLEAEILKVAHHGSDSSSSAEFLSAVAPDDAIISVGPNQYGHPRSEVLQRLAGLGAGIYRTDLDGTVTITTDGVGWTVTLQNEHIATCSCDANSDGMVDIFDLVIVASAYNPHGSVSDLRADVNGDSVVDLFDLVLVAGDYGCSRQIPLPPGMPTPTPIITAIPTQTPTAAATPTITAIPRESPTATATPTWTLAPPATRTPTQTPTRTLTPAATAEQNVVISYIFYNGLESRYEGDEYAEIANLGMSPVNLGGWLLWAGDSPSDQFFWFPEFVLAPGQSCRVYTDEFHPETGGFNFATGRAVWANDGDCGCLYDAASALMSEYCYGKYRLAPYCPMTAPVH
jgi:beta-lactamase superfamily II metal-dependent hydrolase